jgi:hypothetical protein
MVSSELSAEESVVEKGDGDADLWSAAAGELQAKQQREQERKAEVSNAGIIYAQIFTLSDPLFFLT